MVSSLRTLLSAGMQKIENIPNKLVDLGKEIFREKMIENANWFLFTMCKAEIERDELKRELLGLQMEFRRKLKAKIQQKDFKVRGGLRARNNLGL